MGESIVGLDIRPANGQLVGLGSTSRLYSLNGATAEATAIGAGTPFTPALSGTTFGFDFNPTVDRIRVVSNTGQNLRLNPDTGGLAAQDTNLNPGTPSITSVAYTNNVGNASTTQLFDIDSTSDRLLLQNPPNAGTLVDIGPLGIDVDANNGFDIGGRSGTALALLTVSGITSVYQINLGTGAATSVANTTFPAACRAYNYIRTQRLKNNELFLITYLCQYIFFSFMSMIIIDLFFRVYFNHKKLLHRPFSPQCFVLPSFSSKLYA